MTLEEIKERFKYDPESGQVWLWNKREKKYTLTGSTISNGYIRISIQHKGKIVCIFAHRIGYQLYHNTELGDLLIDHINHNKVDNRITNLRAVTSSENQRNMKLLKNNKTGYSGVEIYKGKFRARIGSNKKQINLGTFETIEDAIKVREEAKKKYGFHENHA